MADVRCPMCGKPNPADLDVCQFCQARLKPLLGGSPAPQEEPVPEKSPAEPAAGPEGDASIEDWLQSLRQDEGDEPVEEKGTSQEEIAPAFESSGAEELDWLSSLRSSDETPQLEEEPEEGEAEAGWEPPVEPSGADEPAWLQGLRVEGKAGSEAPESEPESSEAQADEGEPGWLHRIRSLQKSDEDSQEPQADESAPIPEEGQEVELPDWLAGIEAESGSQTSADGESIPDWMSGLASDEQEQAETVEGELAQTDVPDWLAKLTEPAEDRSEQPFIAEDQTDKDIDWLKSSEEFDPSRLFDQDDVLSDQPLEEQPGKVGPFLGNLPDWLAETGSAPGEEQPVGEEEEGLSPGEMPGWLEAMRPEEEAEAGQVSPLGQRTPAEASGPLAGLLGVLPAEPEIPVSKRAQSYGIKLQVSDSQQSHAALLEELVKAEGQVAPVSERQAFSSQAVLRWLIFVVLLLAILWPIYTGSQATALPGYALETFDTSTYINQLPGGAPVLLAVDYEPGLSGEMEAVSAAVIDHLMLKGAYLTMVSTLPTGPAQAERLVQTVNARAGHFYNGIDQYANLGYIPGGPTGLLSFAQLPRQVLPFALDPDSTSVWERAPLAEVRGLADFSLALVITDNPDRARTWIEQVRGSLGDTALVMLVSAQAEPMVRPYYESQPRQVQGMVVGVAGGASYEGLLERNNLGRKYWDAFSYSMSAAVVIVLLGGLGNALLALFDSRKQSQGGR